MKTTDNVMIASSSEGFRKELLSTLHSVRGPFQEAVGGADALSKLAFGNCQTLLLDYRLADLDSQELVSLVEERHPEVDVILMDRESQQLPIVKNPPQHPRTHQLIWALQHQQGMQLGLPVSGPPLDPAYGEAADPVQPDEKNNELLPGVIGSSPKMAAMARKVKLVAARNTALLITGETGTGKDLVALAVHRISSRSAGPFVVVNCAAIPEALLESELFGHARGAFTGALQSRLGRLYAGHGGTLLFDEIGELSLAMQAKLLRFLQDGEIQRLGTSETLRVDVRVLAATNLDLVESVRNKTFRADLYYRLAVFPVELPPLRDRIEDLVPLSAHFLERLCADAHESTRSLMPESWALLRKHSWPGNVRELQHVLERALILAENDLWLKPEHLSLPPSAD